MERHLSEGGCLCSVCISIKTQQTYERQPEPNENRNCFHLFLKYLPRNFPILIVPTSCADEKMHYQNKYVINPQTQKNRLFSNSLMKITENFPLCVHIVVYYERTSTIIYKYDIMKLNQNFLYVQGYYSKPSIKYYFQGQQSMDQFDGILTEKLERHFREMIKDEMYSLSQKERESLKWIHKEYGDDTYAGYLTCLLCMFIKFRWGQTIKKGQFQWSIEGIDEVRLTNVQNLIVQHKKQNKSFQQEYEEKILQKLHENESIQINHLLEAGKGKAQTSQRLVDFRKKIRSIYDKQKTALLQKTEKQRHIESKTLSDDIARYFLPDLKKYKSLREVLNNEELFKKVVLKEKFKPKTNPNHKSFRIKTMH